MKSDEHLALLCIPDALHLAKQSGPLGQQQLLVIVRVKVGRQIDHDRSAEPAVDVIGDNTLQNRSLEEAVKTALVGVEVVGGQCRVVLAPRAARGQWSLAPAAVVGTPCDACTTVAAGTTPAGGSSAARVLEINGQGVAVDRVLLLLLFGELALLRLRLSLRDISDVRAGASGLLP